MLTELVDHEKDIICYIAGEKVDDIVWGAALSECIESLRSRGFVTCRYNAKLTDKGWKTYRQLKAQKGS